MATPRYPWKRAITTTTPSCGKIVSKQATHPTAAGSIAISSSEISSGITKSSAANLSSDFISSLKEKHCIDIVGISSTTLMNASVHDKQ